MPEGHFMTVAAWRRFTPPQQEALTRAFARLEQQMWDYARTSHESALACFTGAPSCTTRRFNVTVVTPPESDVRRINEAVSTAVLPGFRDSCNRVWAECGGVWNQTVGRARGYTIQ